MGDIETPEEEVSVAIVGIEIFDYLGLVVGGFVYGDADLVAGARHGARPEAGQAPLDVEISDLTKIEQSFVKRGPFIHVTAINIVRQVIYFQ